MDINYKELLYKYAEHVEACEGVTFIDDSSKKHSSQMNGIEFTAEEWAALTEIKNILNQH